ncbi:MAG: anion transporter [bacterium]|jgi:Na+/H+ antiporter NhaD/arsenite permease-like protein|nr:anion transporter [candidate division KSB1 bacterium]MDH7560670.1 anion transporter [bacterium]
MAFQDWVSVATLGLTLVGVALGSYPGLRMNRATIALVGATSLEQAYRAVDWSTIVLLFSMMVLNINLRLAGFFRIVSARVVGFARTSRQLLFLIVVVSGVLSAVFLNDTVVLMFTPLLVEILKSLRRDPVPYLVALATAANVGSAATIIGNPQNMLIGMASKISFGRFVAAMAPVALAGLLVCYAVVVLVYRREFKQNSFHPVVGYQVRTSRPLLIKSLIAFGLMMVALVAGMPTPLAALGAASTLLVTRRIKPARVFTELDWSLLVFFASLFVVTHAVNVLVVSGLHGDLGRLASGRGLATLSAVAVVLSNLVSNVPAVLLLRPIAFSWPEPNVAWLTLAMATTFAGNLTLLGSVANLIVAESARARGVRLSIAEYLKAGVPITLLTVALGVIWLTRWA